MVRGGREEAGGAGKDGRSHRAWVQSVTGFIAGVGVGGVGVGGGGVRVGMGVGVRAVGASGVKVRKGLIGLDV